MLMLCQFIEGEGHKKFSYFPETQYIKLQVLVWKTQQVGHPVVWFCVIFGISINPIFVSDLHTAQEAANCEENFQQQQHLH